MPLAIRKSTDVTGTMAIASRNGKVNASPVKQENDSVIGTHLLSSNECSSKYSKDCFRIFGWVKSSVHLSVFEVVCKEL